MQGYSQAYPFRLHKHMFIGLVIPLSAQPVRSYDGAMNNLTYPDWGQAGASMLRMTSNGFSDGMSEMGGHTRPNPRLISNVLFHQEHSMPNALGISDFGWAFGQFMDHDITFVNDHPTEHIDIPVPPLRPVL